MIARSAHPCSTIGTLSEVLRGGMVINMLTDMPTIDVLAINALGGVLVDVGAGMLTDIEVAVVVPTVITVKFAPPVSQGVDMLSAVAVDILIEALTDGLADANVNVLAAAMTALWFAMSSL